MKRLLVGLSIAFCAHFSLAQNSATAFSAPNFVPLVKQLSPVVVSVRTISRSKYRPVSQQDFNDIMRRFGISQGGAAQQEEPETVKGVGSGFIVSSDGFIMTNAHVVNRTDDILVSLADEREFKARVIGIDPRGDIALLKIDAGTLPTVKLGSSANLEVGEWVIAIGSPYGLENMVTHGIVSAKDRDVGDLLQGILSDVPINPGNSGGPLFNTRGEVVAINSQIITKSGSFAGVSVSIPIDDAVNIAAELKLTGKMTRGRIGIVVEPLARETLAQLKLAGRSGVNVRSIESGAPADKAGLKKGDIITRIGNKSVTKMSDLTRAVMASKPGVPVSIRILRNGQPFSANVIPVELTDAD